MNKEELVKEMASTSGLSKKDSEKALNAFLGIVPEELAKGGKVALVGFGTFETRPRAEKKGRNPQTAEEIVIPATTVPVFKPGEPFKAKVR
jgi:DNA-binding protein HU-beta